MVRKFSIELAHDGTAIVSSETDVKYSTHERGIEVLIGLINVVLPKKVPPKPVQDPQLGQISRDIEKESEQRKMEDAALPPPAPVAAKLKAKYNPPDGEEKKPAAVKKSETLAAQNEWQIPFSSTKQKSEYQNARNLCRKYKKPYRTALKLKEEEDRKWRERHPGKRTRSEQASINAGGRNKKASAVDTAKQSAQAIPPSNEAKESGGTVTDYEGQELALPPAAPQENGDKITTDAPVDSGIVTGMHVRQVKPDAGRQIFGNGVVLSRHGEIVAVRNGNGKTYKILAACLEPVTGPVSDKAQGGAV